MSVRVGKTALLLGLLCASTARANGAFPAVSQLVADPADPAHLVLRSNFGLLVTQDRGKSWDWVCEASVGYADIEPPIALLADGTTIVGLPTGIARSSAAECDFSAGSGIAAYVADVTRVPNAAGQAAAVSVDGAGSSQVWHTLDGGQSWSAWGNPLSGVYGATLDMAADPAQTLYVSGVVEAGAVSGVLARSTDRGQSWASFDVPGVNNVSAPYIAAVSASDANTVFVRLSGAPGHLLVTHDGGQHFVSLLDFAGPIEGFALSPDGRFALAAGPVDGVWRASTATLRFERLPCAHVRCLSWSEGGLFACADEDQAGFVVGESEDSGLSFQPRLHLPCVRGPLACGSESSVARACSTAWPMLLEQLGTVCPAAGAPTPSADCANGGSADANAEPPSGESGTSAGLRPGGTSGCTLSTRSGGPWQLLAVLVTAFALTRRRRARSADTA